MRPTWTIVLLLAAGHAFAADSPQDKSGGPAAKVADAKSPDAQAPTPAQLQARLLRLQAALLEARAAETPDAEKLAQLRKQIQAIQGKLAGLGRDGFYGGRGTGVCPWGGPGRGYGPAWGGQGRGYGRGGGWNRGTGGPGTGFGGRGTGWGYIDADNDGLCDNFPGRQQ